MDAIASYIALLALASLAAPGLQVAQFATLHPKRECCIIGVCKVARMIVRPLVGGVVLRLFDAKPTRQTGCVWYINLRLYARWRSPPQETILRRSDFMLSLTWAWSSSLRVGRLPNDTPLPRTKSCGWLHRSRPPPPSRPKRPYNYITLN